MGAADGEQFMGRQTTSQELLEMLRPTLAGSGLDLEDVEVSAVGRRRLVRVLVDKDGGVTLDEVADATGLVGRVLDEHDAFGDAPYTLEVTSPGVDRPLTLPRHWRRNTDRLVKISLRDGGSFVGRVIKAGDAAAVVDVDGEKRDVPYADVTGATVEVEFNRGREKE
jgi:ribosome maturation factor RimP